VGNSNKYTEKSELIYGQENVVATLLQILSRAKNMVDICADFRAPSISIEVEPYNRALLNLKSRGVRFRQITEITKDNLSFSKELMKVADIRHIDGAKANFITSENEYLAPVILFKKEKVTLQTIYSKEVEDGIKPIVVEIIREPIEIQNLLINLIKSATKEIMLMIPTTNTIHRQADIGILQLLKKIATDSNVNIRIMAPLNDYSVKQKIQNVLSPPSSPSSLIQVRNIETSSATKSTIVIIDRKESLVTEVNDDSKDTFSGSLGFATYSNSRSTVLSYVSIFESFWLQTEMYKKIKETERMQKEFINIAAHELRGPIQPILGLTQVVRFKMKDTELQKLQDVVIRNAKRLQRLTDDILDVTKIESNLLHLNKEVFNLNDLIFRIIDDDKSQIDNKDIKLIYQDSSNSDDNNIIIVQADKYRLNQVISNLISNSIKFTNKGGTIFITTKREKDNKAIIISIKDTGIGIDPEIMPRLFTRFASKSFQGTGLGLYISKSIIEAHGGRIWATNNTDGKGAIFTFSLPLEKEKSMPKYKN